MLHVSYKLLDAKFPTKGTFICCSVLLAIYNVLHSDKNSPQQLLSRGSQTTQENAAPQHRPVFIKTLPLYLPFTIIHPSAVCMPGRKQFLIPNPLFCFFVPKCMIWQSLQFTYNCLHWFLPASMVCCPIYLVCTVLCIYCTFCTCLMLRCVHFRQQYINVTAFLCCTMLLVTVYTTCTEE